ncbi:MAG: sulfatase-like hydrolase/transferase [Oligoflexia bacterium]|nr:sulfatase-like hydrolase/transferase [Oligoflexia bacterium]
MIHLLGILALACGPASAASEGSDGTGALALDRRPDLLVSVSVPEGSRDKVVPGAIPLGGDWRLMATVRGVRTWQTQLPVRPRTLFFRHPPPGMALLQREPDQPWKDARTLAHREGISGADRVDSWEFTSDLLRVRRPSSAGPPAAGEYAMRYQKAVEREQQLQRRSFDGSDADFVMRSLQLQDTTRHGLLLPAPATAHFRITVPPDAVFTAVPGIMPPELVAAGVRSDGATLVLTVDGTEVAREPLRVGEFRPVHYDISGWAGQQVDLALKVEPGLSSDLDYAFVAGPTVYTPQVDPPRVVILFVDTLRQDELSLYGYSRSTTPDLDAWAAGATVFDDARSVAPWTLPSTRGLLLGTQPERWGQVETLQERAAAAGWATGFMAGNVYLSSNFDMNRGWGTHRCINWPTADIEVARTRAWLNENADRPALVVLHTMDMHLPYTEPRAYRHIFAGDLPPELGSLDFQRNKVILAVAKIGEVGKQYVRDRYDNSLRFVNDQLGEFLGDLSPRDTVVFLSDHGEEFWDHNGYEHGHSLYDELLRVPLVIAGPGFPSGRVAAPVSLLDVAPTLATAMGLDTDGMTGLPLQGVLDGKLDSTLADRAIGFGRPLYGKRMWGVLEGNTKYTSLEGTERVFDLDADPGEHRDLVRTGKVDRDALAQAMSRAVERPVATVLRLLPARSGSVSALVVTAQVPGGIAEVWAAQDPLHLATVTIDTSVDSQATITWAGKARGQREVYLFPARPLAEVLPEIEMTVRHKGPAVALSHAQQSGWPQEWTGRSTPLFRGRAGGRAITVDYARVPLPDDDATALVGVDSELQQDLKSLGYVER